MGKKMFVPVKPGFKFECNMCGDCCRNINGIFLTRMEIARLKEYNVPIFFQKSVGEDEEGKELVVVIPTIAIYQELGEPKQCYCQGDGQNPNACSLHRIRPLTCYRFPFSIFTFRNGPPDLEMGREVLRDKALTEEELAEFVVELSYETGGEKVLTWYHIFAAQQITDNGGECPGFGLGNNEWDAEMIEAYIRKHYAMFEEHTAQVDATIRDYSIQFGKDFDKHFEPVYHVENLYKPKKRDWQDIIDEPGSRRPDAQKEARKEACHAPSDS